MTRPNADELLTQAMKLPADERLALATKLLDSVEGPEDVEWSKAWMAELDRRMELVENGEVATEDWETVKASLVKNIAASEANPARPAGASGASCCDAPI